MKKLLIIMLALALVLAVFAGCGDKGKNDTKGGSMDVVVGGAAAAYSNDWLKGLDLPFIVPEYKGGTLKDAKFDGEHLSVSIVDTSVEACEKYKDEVAKAGWDVRMTGDGYCYAYTDEWRLMLSYTERQVKNKEAAIFVDPYDPEKESSGGEFIMTDDWPKDLPFDFDLPKYTDGKIKGSTVNNNGVSVTVIDTSDAAVKKYIDELEKAGWKAWHVEDGFYAVEQGGWNITLRMEDNGTELFILITS